MSTKTPTSIEYVKVDKLRFDPENPRLAYRGKSTSESEVFEFMIQNANVFDLMGSISEQGFFPGEPLLVVPDDTESDMYIVVEGNRRLAAVKLLLHPENATHRRKAIEDLSHTTSDAIKAQIEKLPVLRFPDRDDILGYLGYRHITGIQTWGPLAKAKYLKQLALKKQRELAKSQSTPNQPTYGSRDLDFILAKEIGSRADYVGQMLAGLEVYEKIEKNYFFEIPRLNVESLEFGILYTGIGYTNIYQFIGMENRRDRELRSLNQDHLRELTTWMFKEDGNGKTVLGESRDLDKLDAVVAESEALSALRSGATLDTAYALSKGPGQSFFTQLQLILNDLKEAWKQFEFVREVGQTEQDLIIEIVRLATKLRGAIEDSFLSKSK